MPANPLKPKLGEPHHVAYLVDDIAATVARLVEQLGAGPFFHIERVPLEAVRSQGEDAAFVHDAAFGYSGAGAIELMQATEVAPQRVEAQFDGPRPRVHHLGYVLPPEDVESARAALDAGGVPEYLRSEFGGAVTTLHTASPTLGHDLEIHADNEGLRGFFGMVKDASWNWDGSQPLRPLEL
jgi:hypothetical protein